MTTSGAPRTVDDVSAPYGNYLRYVPAAGEGVCTVCHTAVWGYDVCYPCNNARLVLEDQVADVSAVISLAVRGEQLAHELKGYKSQLYSPATRQQWIYGFGAVLWRWLGQHERCMTTRLAATKFDLVTSVPSTSGRTEVHPLHTVVADTVEGVGTRYGELLVPDGLGLGRTQSASRFRATRDLAGASVLLVDDTWTTGAHLQSGSAALKAAGASEVGVLALGRWLEPNYRAAETGAWLRKHASMKAFSWGSCCLETPAPTT